MGLLDDLFRADLDPKAAHNEALQNFLAVANSGPQTPNGGQRFGGGDGSNFPGAPSSGIVGGILSELAAPRSLEATQTAIGPNGPGLTLADISNFLTKPRGEKSIFAPDPPTPNEYYPQQLSQQQIQQKQGLATPWSVTTESLPGSLSPVTPQQPVVSAAPTAQTPGAATGPELSPNLAPQPAAAPTYATNGAAGGQFQPDFIDRLSAFGRGLAADHGILGAIGDAAGARNPNDLQTMNATYNALVSKGVSPDMAKAAALNPQFGVQVMSHMFPELTDIGTGIYGPIKGWANPLNQTVTGINGQATSTLTGPGGMQDVLQTMQTDPGFAADVRAYAQGREMPTGRPGPYQAAVRRAAQMAYNTDETTYNTRLALRKNMEAGGKGADMKVAANAAIDHLSNMSAQGEALHNVSGFGVFNNAINSIHNTISEQRGTSERDQALVKFEQAKKLAIKELNDFYVKGGGTEAERKALENDVRAAGTPQQIQAATANAIHMLSSKIAPLEDQWNRVFSGTGEKFDMLSDQSRAKAAKVYARAGLDANGDPVSAQPQQSAAPITATGPNGQKLVLINGKWAVMGGR